MAIGTGSGGLKYRLPNRAEIQARQNAAAASAGGSAAASAYGANRRYAGLKKQIQADAIQSGLDRGFKAQQSFLDRGFRARQSELERDLDRELQGNSLQAMAERQAAQFEQQKQLQLEGQYFDNLQTEKYQQFQTDRDQARFEQDQVQFERSVDAGYEEGLASGALALDQQQANRKRDLDNWLSDPSNGTPDQRAEAEAERRRILRSARKPQGLDATGTLQQGLTYVDEQGVPHSQPGPGRRAYNTQTNQFLEQPEQGDSYLDQVDARTGEIKGTEKGGKEGGQYTYDEAREQAKKEVTTEQTERAQAKARGLAAQAVAQSAQQYRAQQQAAGMKEDVSISLKDEQGFYTDETEPRTTSGGRYLGIGRKVPIRGPQMPSNINEYRAANAQAAAGQASLDRMKAAAAEQQAAGQQGKMPQPTTEADYNALPSGSRYIGPDGKERIKS